MTLFGAGELGIGKNAEPYLLCQNNEYVPLLSVYGAYGLIKNDVDSSDFRAKGSGYTSVTGTDLSARLHIWNGILTGNATFVEIRYDEETGKMDNRDDDTKIGSDINIGEISLYEYGYDYQVKDFMMIGLGYTENKMVPLNSGTIYRFKNPYLKIGLGYEGIVASDFYMGIEVYALGSLEGKVDVDFGGTGQTVKQSFTYGGKGVIPMIYKFTKHVEGVLQGEYRIMKYGESDTVNGVTIPYVREDTIKFSLGLRINLF